MRVENLSLAAAISQQCVEETYQTLDPIASVSEQDKLTRENKGRRFNQGFLGGDSTVFDFVSVKEHLEEYTRCFTDYHIEILSRPLPPSQQTEDISDIDSLVQQTKKGMSVYGQHSLNSHILPAFKEIIEKLAAELKAKTEALSDLSVKTVVAEKPVP